MLAPAVLSKLPSKSDAGRAPVRTGGRSFPAPALAQREEVVQCWLNPVLLAARPADAILNHVGQLANAYNAHQVALVPVTRTARINELGTLERAVYTWFEANRTPDLDEQPTAVWMKQLLNSIQREHTTLVRLAVNNNDADPPVANFAQLPPPQKRKVRRIWTHLVNQTGNIRITETENYTNAANAPAQFRHRRFRFDVLAQFARLLETDSGREIVAKVDRDTGGTKLVTIQPGMAAPTGGRPGSEFAAGPVHNDGRDGYTQVDVNAILPADLPRYRVIVLNHPSPLDRVKAIHDARTRYPHALGVRINNLYYRFGAGTGANVTLTRDIRDSADHHTSRVVDAQGNELIFPNHITLGHELGHAGHMIDGTALGEAGVSGALLPQVDPAAQVRDWSNLEEYGTIHNSENALRRGYGMSARHGHINHQVFQRRLIEPVVDELFHITALMTNPSRTAIETPLNAAGNHLAGLQVRQARASIDAGMNLLLNSLNAGFPNFIALQINLIRTPLQQARPRLQRANPAGLHTAMQEVLQARDAARTAQQTSQRNIGGRGLAYTGLGLRAAGGYAGTGLRAAGSYARSWLPF